MGIISQPNSNLLYFTLTKFVKIFASRWSTRLLKEAQTLGIEMWWGPRALQNLLLETFPRSKPNSSFLSNFFKKPFLKLYSHEASRTLVLTIWLMFDHFIQFKFKILNWQDFQIWLVCCRCTWKLINHFCKLVIF